MTQKQMLELVLAGRPVLVGTYLSGRVEEIKIRDKTTGKMRSGYVTRETIITKDDAIVVGRFLNDDENVKDFKPSGRGGEKVCVLVTKQESVQGFKLFAGAVEPLAD